MNKKLLAAFIGVFLIAGLIQVIPHARSFVEQTELERFEQEATEHRRVSEQSMIQDGIFDFNKR